MLVFLVSSFYKGYEKELTLQNCCLLKSKHFKIFGKTYFNCLLSFVLNFNSMFTLKKPKVDIKVFRENSVSKKPRRSLILNMSLFFVLFYVFFSDLYIKHFSNILIQVHAF